MDDRFPEGDDEEGFPQVDSSAHDDEPGDPEPDAQHEARARDLLGESDDPSVFSSIQVVRPGASAPEDVPVGEAPSLPHWTDPPTGELPRIFPSGDENLDPWATLSSSQPRWRDQASGWNDTDLSALGDDMPVMGTRDATAASDSFFTFDATEPDPEIYTVPRDPSEPYGGLGADPYVEGRSSGPSGGRNMGVATLVGVGMAAVGLFLLNTGPWAAMGLVVVVLVMASAEIFRTLRRVGYTPPALVGLVAAAALPLASYWRGEPGLAVALVLTMVASLLWYLLGIDTEHAVPNIGVTLLTVVYVGVLGSFAALLLRSPDGVGLLLAAVLGPIAYDIAGLFIGRSIGRSPLSSASPNKTIEGTVGGMIAALLVTWIVVGGVIGGGIAPFNSPSDALLLGVALACVAPIGDLCESLLKRDLGVKDMGSLLPGHGGVLDRFDAILFALPATFFVASMVL